MFTKVIMKINNGEIRMLKVSKEKLQTRKENLSHIKERQLFTETYSVPQSRELENMSLNFYGSGKNHSVLKCFE